METGMMPRNRQWGDVDLVILCILHQFLLITCVTPVSLGCHIPAPHVHQKAQAERRKKSWQGAEAVLCSFLLYPRTQKSAPNISVSPGINSLHFKSFIRLKAHLKNREIQGGRCREGQGQQQEAQVCSWPGIHGWGSADVLLVLSPAWTIPCVSQGSLQAMPHLDFHVIQAAQERQWLSDSFWKTSTSPAGGCGC